MNCFGIQTSKKKKKKIHLNHLQEMNEWQKKVAIKRIVKAKVN